MSIKKPVAKVVATKKPIAKPVAKKTTTMTAVKKPVVAKKVETKATPKVAAKVIKKPVAKVVATKKPIAKPVAKKTTTMTAVKKPVVAKKVETKTMSASMTAMKKEMPKMNHKRNENSGDQEVALKAIKAIISEINHQPKASVIQANSKMMMKKKMKKGNAA